MLLRQLPKQLKKKMLLNSLVLSNKPGIHLIGYLVFKCLPFLIILSPFSFFNLFADLAVLGLSNPSF
jgi:hypothetical protein